MKAEKIFISLTNLFKSTLKDCGVFEMVKLYNLLTVNYSHY